MWQQTYKDGIRPVEGARIWLEINMLPVLPPPWRLNNPGKPSNYARRKGTNETSSSSNKTKLTLEKSHVMFKLQGRNAQ